MVFLLQDKMIVVVSIPVRSILRLKHPFNTA